MNELLGKKIKKIREIKGFSQRYVAAKLNISQERYSYLENKQKNITEEQLKKIANLFDVPLQFIKSFDPENILGNPVSNIIPKSKKQSPRLDAIDECMAIIYQLKEKIYYIEKELQNVSRT